jgi:putative effector of murein hydrolase
MLLWCMLFWLFLNVVSYFAGRSVGFFDLRAFGALAVILALTVYKKFSDYRHAESSIISTVYGGSMFYMSCIIGTWK